MEQRQPPAALHDGDYRVRMRAIQRLADEQVLHASEWIRPLLRDRESPVRNAAIVALGVLHDQDSFEALSGCLGAPTSRERLNAVEALMALDNPLMKAPLITALATESAPAVRMAIVRALSRFTRDAQVSHALIQALEDDDEDARATAAIALARMGATEALPALCQMAATDTNAETSVNRMWTFNSIVTQRAIGALLAPDEKRELNWPDYQ